MAIYLADIVGSPSIGVYSLATDQILIIPNPVAPKKAERMAEWLKVKLISTSVGGTILAGALACANSNGILLPHIVREREVEAIKSCFDGNITVMETRKTAYGNLILANDRGAIVDPRFKPSEIKEIAETLDVEAFASEIAGHPTLDRLQSQPTKEFWRIRC